MSLSHVWTRATRRWRQRDHYSGTGDWLRAMYSRILRGRAGRYLPGKGRLTKLRLATLDAPFWIRMGATDSRVLEQIFMDDEYGAVTRLDLGTVRQIVDLGSNVGFSIRWWKRFFPFAVVVGVEPHPDTFALCQQNTAEINGVHLIQACVVGRARTVYLDTTAGAWAVTMTDRANGRTPVRGATVPELMAEAGMSGTIDLLKVDIEGAEAELFADCCQWIHLVRTLVIELHSPYRRAAFLQHLREADASFDCQVLQDGPLVEVLMLRRTGDRAA